MAQDTNFSIGRGALVCDCLPQTYQFIEENLAFFYGSISKLNDALGDEGGITFVSNEEAWSFACTVTKTELGRVASARGILGEGGKSRFDDLLTALSDTGSDSSAS